MCEQERRVPMSHDRDTNVALMPFAVTRLIETQRGGSMTAFTVKCTSKPILGFNSGEATEM